MTTSGEPDRPTGYGSHARARFIAEARKANDSSPRRSPFARDRARVLHCSALRRLAGKTQVFVAGESDVPRTRLTHSLEVAQVARELGQSLGCDPDVVDVAGLAHDLGHPPFGHNGEDALDAVASECGGFEGNAQTFRVLTRLEAKVIDEDAPASVGLNLSRASLDAVSKYPWPRREGRRKFGVYDDDRVVFDWMREGAEPDRCCLEAQVMDWADDVAYSVHDIDDALQLGWFDPGLLQDADERARVVDRCIAWYLPEGDPAALDDALRRLQAQDFWVGSFDGTTRSLAQVKRMTSELIGRFSTAAEHATRERFGPDPLSRYSADLIVPEEIRHEVGVMKAVAATYVMLRSGAETEYARQRELLTDVVAALTTTGPEALEPWLVPRWESAPDDAARTRVVLDQVASLTDASVLRWHRRLCG
ncbi:MAG: deoxyguanosinetriphosphate triphosphohydrolase [Candidatus Nanopelagicales bacterium]